MAKTETAAGVWAPALTPLTEDLVPDSGRAIAHVKRLLDGGCHGAALFGTTGEATSFSVEQRVALLEAVLEAGVAPERLMVGTGCCALADSLRLTAHAAGLGVKKVLMLPPFYYKGTGDQGLFDSYAAVIDRVGDPELALYLYHFPRLSGVPITHGLVAQLLAAYPETVKGLKDSTGDPESCAGFIAGFPGLAVFPGTESIMLDMLLKGAAGCITASANVNGAAIRRVYDAWRAEGPEARELQNGITALRMVLQANPMIPTLKHLLAERLDDPAWRRLCPPLTPLTAEQLGALDSGLGDLGFSLEAA